MYIWSFWARSAYNTYWVPCVLVLILHFSIFSDVAPSEHWIPVAITDLDRGKLLAFRDLLLSLFKLTCILYFACQSPCIYVYWYLVGPLYICDTRSEVFGLLLVCHLATFEPLLYILSRTCISILWPIFLILFLFLLTQYLFIWLNLLSSASLCFGFDFPTRGL